MAGVGPGSHSTKQNYDLDQIWGDLRAGIEQVFQRQGMQVLTYFNQEHNMLSIKSGFFVTPHIDSKLHAVLA